MSFLKIASVLLTVAGSSCGHSDAATSTETTTLLQVPLITTPLPPVDTNCYSFDVYLDKITLPSLRKEDFIIVRHKAVIRSKEVCGEILNDDSQDSSLFCAETEVKFDPNMMCNADYRSSVIVCRKWWGEKHQELGNNTFLNNPPNPKDISTLCVIFPSKPWCDPREVCAWYPNLPRCTRGNVQTTMVKPLLSQQLPSVVVDDHHDVWFIAGILKSNNYLPQKSDCDDEGSSKFMTIWLNDLFLRLTKS